MAIKQMMEEEREKVRNEEREKSKQEYQALKQELEKEKHRELEQCRINMLKKMAVLGKVTVEDAAEELGITVKQFEQQILTS